MQEPLGAAGANRLPSIAPPVYRALAAAAALLLAAPVLAQSGGIPAELVHYPEFVLVNGKVLTADADRDFSVAEAVAVRGNRIFAVGSDARIRPLAGPSTRVIDLRGRSVTPGFIYNDGDNSVPAGDILKDSQWKGATHPHLGGGNVDEALATLSFIVEQEGESGVPMFFNLTDTLSGTAMHAWDRNTLDEVAPDVPVIIYLESSEGLLNTAMIELALEAGFPAGHMHLDRDESG
jgi:predicted amidohydrolase YtcJ